MEEEILMKKLCFLAPPCHGGRLFRPETIGGIDKKVSFADTSGRMPVAWEGPILCRLISTGS